MESQLSSPERVPQTTRKVTYLERKKRKRTLSTATPDSDSDSSSVSKYTASSMKTPSSPAADKKVKKTSASASASKGPKQVDVSLPGPSPKRARRDSEESIKPPKVKRAPKSRAKAPSKSPEEVPDNLDEAPAAPKKPEHARRDSNESVKPPKAKKALQSRAEGPTNSPKENLQQSDDSPSVFKKPESVRKPKSKAKSIAAEEDFDDNVSIADSSISTMKIRRNESERIEYFKNQPECGNLEPRSAQCIVCDKVVNLGRKQTYAIRPWEIHRGRCDLKAAQANPIPDHAEASPEVEEPVASPSVLTSTFDPTAARRPNEADRKEFLQADKQIMELEKHRACCNKCHKWVDLSPTQPYATGNWVKHKIRCSDAVPSNRVAAAKRKLLVVNDKQVKTFTPRNIDCAFCGVSVPLEGEGDFNLTCWDEHKGKCTKSVPVSRSDINTVAFPSRFPRPPHSSASTEDTLVMDTAASGSTPGMKRPRQESEAVHEDESRASARTRTSAYIPPDMEPPSSVMGWFMLPFHSFVRGFKESLKDRS